MRVSRSRKPLQHFYSLGSEILQEVSDAKYLGIQIDNKLDWNKHISTVAARGQSKLAFLNRNLKGCPKKLRDTAYISLIRPALEYSCSVWHPHKKSNKDKIEKVQRRQILTVNGVFHISKPIPRSFEIFPQHSFQVVYHRPPKLPGTGNTFSRSCFSKKVVRPL